MRGAWGLAVLLLGPALTGLAGGTEGEAVRVHVRIEGTAARMWSGWVTLGATYTLTAANSGRAYTLDARTPLGALVAAADAADLGLEVSDDFDDFQVFAVNGERHWNTAWWDYRVDWVQTNWGNQRQWLAWGAPVHPLADSSEIVWYPEIHFTTPLRLRDAGDMPGCLHVVGIEALVTDPLLQPGEPWPTLTWRPQPAMLKGGGASSALAAGWGFAKGPGEAWAEDLPLPVTPLYHFLRSERLPLDCQVLRFLQ